MSNVQIAQKIKDRCKEKNISVAKLLSECGIRKSLIYDLEKRDYTPSVTIVEQIANYLDCSVDYLLGRVPEPKFDYSITGDNNMQTVNNGANSKVIVTKPPKKDRATEEILEIIQSLPLVKRAEAVLYLNDMRKDA